MRDVLFQIIGIALAVVDFAGLSEKLESILDQFREKVSAAAIAFWRDLRTTEAKRIGERLQAAAWVLACFAANQWLHLVDPQRIYRVAIFVTVPLIIIAECLALIWLLWAVLHLMNKAPGHTVGSVGLLLAIFHFSEYSLLFGRPSAYGVYGVGSAKGRGRRSEAPSAPTLMRLARQSRPS